MLFPKKIETAIDGYYYYLAAALIFGVRSPLTRECRPYMYNKRTFWDPKISENIYVDQEGESYKKRSLITQNDFMIIASNLTVSGVCQTITVLDRKMRARNDEIFNDDYLAYFKEKWEPYLENRVGQVGAMIKGINEEVSEIIISLVGDFPLICQGLFFEHNGFCKE